MEVDKVSVTDRYGNTVEVTNNGDGTYSFIQPRGSVTIEVSFKTAVCDGGRDCPSYHFSDIDTSQWYHEAVDYVVANGCLLYTSLYVDSQHTTCLADSPDFPDGFKPLAAAMAKALGELCLLYTSHQINNR